MNLHLLIDFSKITQLCYKYNTTRGFKMEYVSTHIPKWCFSTYSKIITKYVKIYFSFKIWYTGVKRQIKRYTLRDKQYIQIFCTQQLTVSSQKKLTLLISIANKYYPNLIARSVNVTSQMVTSLQSLQGTKLNMFHSSL